MYLCLQPSNRPVAYRSGPRHSQLQPRPPRPPVRHLGQLLPVPHHGRVQPAAHRAGPPVLRRQRVNIGAGGSAPPLEPHHHHRPQPLRLL